MKFSHKILLAAALVVAVAFACFILFNDYRQREALSSSTEASMQELGSLTTSNIQTWLESRIQLLQSLSQQVAVDGSAPASLKRIIDLPAYTGNFQLSYFGGADGVMFSVPAGNRAPDYDPRARGWYKAANSAQQTIVTEPYIAASSGKLVITVATPVQRQGQMIGVAGADIDLTSVSAIINSLNFGGHGHAFIVSADGKILIHPDSKLVLKTLAEAYPERRAESQPGPRKKSSSTARRQLISFTRVNGVPSADWYVALVLDKDTAFSMLSEFRTSALIAMVIAVVIIIALLGMLIRVLMQPLLTMGRAMHDIAEGEGDLTKRLVIHGNDEFGALGTVVQPFRRAYSHLDPRSVLGHRPSQRSRPARGRRVELVDVQLRSASLAHQQRGGSDQPARRRRPGNRPERRPRLAAFQRCAQPGGRRSAGGG